MSDDKPKEWTLRELAAETGVTERTVRYYISRDLVDPPLRAGRGAAYGEKHKAQIEAVRELQAKGLMLSQIEHALATGSRRGPASDASFGILNAPESPHMLWFEKDGSLDRSQAAEVALSADRLLSPPAAALPEPETWRSYRVSPDVVVMHRAGAAPWRTRRVLDALRRFAAEISSSIPKEDQGE